MKIFLLLLLLISWSIVASAKQPEPVLNEAAEAAAQAVLDPLVKSLDQPTSIFHWEAADAPLTKKFDISKPEGVRDMVKEQIDSFLGMNSKYGFYSATDPVASHSYGKGNNFLLMQVDLPVGFRYLEIRNDLELMFKLEPILGDYCARQIANSITVDFSENPCSELKRRLFKKLGVLGIRYKWDRPQLGNLCQGKDESAFLITDSGWLEPKYLKTYTASTRVDGDMRRRINEIYLHSEGLLADYRVKNFGAKILAEFPRAKPLWPDTPKVEKVSADTLRWMRENLLNCQADKPTTDSAPQPEPEQKEGASAE